MVTKDLVMFAKILEALGVGNFETLEERIAIQKKIYLLQLLGVKMGYIFGWDIYGPFSKSLTRDCRIYEESKEEVDEVASKFNFNEFGKEKMKLAQQLTAPPTKGEKTFEYTAWLELLATINYLADHLFKSLPKRDEVDKVRQVNKLLVEKKPHFLGCESLVTEAWKRLWKCLSKESDVMATP